MAKMATRKLCAATLSGFWTVLSHPVRGKCFSVSIACRKGKGVASMVKKKYFYEVSREMQEKATYCDRLTPPRPSSPLAGVTSAHHRAHRKCHIDHKHSPILYTGSSTILFACTHLYSTRLGHHNWGSKGPNKNLNDILRFVKCLSSNEWPVDAQR